MHRTLRLLPLALLAAAVPAGAQEPITVGHDGRLVVDLPSAAHYRMHVSACRAHESGAYRLSVRR